MDDNILLVESEKKLIVEPDVNYAYYNNEKEEKKDGGLLSQLIPNNTTTWILLVSSLTLTILFLVASYFGARKKWYQSLPVKSGENTWVIAALWVVASLISYGVFYFIKDKDEAIYGQSRIFPYFVIIVLGTE